MNSLPSLYALKAFVAAAQTLSFSVAAAQLFLTQSAISHHVKNLERHFGKKLFVRSGGKLKLTHFGLTLYQDLAPLYEGITAACLKHTHLPQAFKLKAANTVALHWLIEPLNRFNQQQAGPQVVLHSPFMQHDHVNFQQEPFDAALLCLAKLSPDWHAVHLFDERLTPICTPAFWAGLACQTRLPEHALLHASSDHVDWLQWQQTYPEVFSIAYPHSGKIFDTLGLAMSAAAQGLGMALADQAFIQPLLASGQVIAPVAPTLCTGNAYYLVWPKNHPQQALWQAFGAVLKQAAPNA
ncbi:MAG: LysR family transcriptional regulator [Neisseriaceae bacterium]|nr:LysR family transcriptional regulator [Neisseriaceae bacterium]